MDDENYYVEELLILHAWMVMLAGYYLLLKRRQRRGHNAIRPRPRRCWVRPIDQNRYKRGHFFTLLQEMKRNDPEQFFAYARMTPRQFGVLLRKVRPLLRKRSHRAICPEERLALTLKYLSQGTSMQNIMLEYCLGKSTVSYIIRETCIAIWTVLQPECLPGPSEWMWENVATGFWNKWKVPNCLGAIDGITIQSCQQGGLQSSNYKRLHSITLMAACDAHCRFTMVDIGGCGSQGDSSVLRASEFGQAIFSEDLNVPIGAKLPNTDQEVPYYFVGNEAFPIRHNLVCPYSKPPRGLFSDEERMFNYRVSRATRAIENAFGILSSRWRILLRPIVASVETVNAIVKATVCLHNFLMFDEHLLPAQQRRYCPPHFEDHEDDDGNIIDGGWRVDIRNFGAVQSRECVGANNGEFGTPNVRSILTKFFSDIGEVPWQYKLINRGTAPN